MENKRIALISEKMPAEISEILKNLGYGCVGLKAFECLDAPVAHHPDMLFSRLSDGKMLCDGRYLISNPALNELGIEFLPSAVRLDKKYPFDIAFDALVFGDTVYCKTDSTAPEILQDRNTVDVKQGYALCSTLVTNKCAVTADGGIYTALCKNGVDALKISAGNILLKGYGNGFIGGASCFDACSDTVIFFGNPIYHPDFGAISDFLAKHGHKISYPDKIPLADYGGAKLFIK
jgi:hypothetical protein